MEARLLELEYDQTCRSGVYLSYNVIEPHGRAFISVRICSNNMQEERLFELEYDQTCRRGVHLSYVIKRDEGVLI